MSLYITSLNSGSNGNCYYVGNEKEAVLIDAGISCREMEKRLARSGLSVLTIKAVFISHEHADHIRGLEVFARKHRLPVYITPRTQKNSSLQLDEKFVYSFNAYEEICIGELRVTAFPKLHDASDPHSFTITQAGVTIGVFTDIGYACSHVIENFKRCDAVFLEANYDETMLDEGHYPYHLKKRISSDKGHLSNKQALELLYSIKHPNFLISYCRTFQKKTIHRNWWSAYFYNMRVKHKLWSPPANTKRLFFIFRKMTRVACPKP